MNERHEEIIRCLREQGEVSVENLVSRLAVSEATVRRDLAMLVKAGSLMRTFGGARLVEASSLILKTFEQKRMAMRESKEKIARCVAELVEPGMSVALDSRTTTWSVAAALKNKAPLDIVTNSLPVVEEIGGVEGVRIICPGGRFNLTNLDFIGAETARFVSHMHVDILLLGVDNFIPGRGVFTNSRDDADVQAAFAGIADKCVVVADSTKICRKGLFMAVPSSRVDILVTDDGLDDETKTILQTEPYKLIVAE